MYEIKPYEALDIDEESDFIIADIILKSWQNL